MRILRRLLLLALVLLLTFILAYPVMARLWSRPTVRTRSDRPPVVTLPWNPPVSSISSAASSVVSSKSVEEKPSTYRGIFLTAGSVQRTASFDEYIHSVQRQGGNAIVFDVKGNTVYFESKASLATELGLISHLYDLPSVVQKLHGSGITAIARYVAVSDPLLAKLRPDTNAHHPKTGAIIRSAFVDPANETVLEYNRQVLCEVAASGVDEINLDYIRFSTAEFGALKVFSGKDKADRIEQFIKMARETIDRCKGNQDIKLGISTYAILGWNYQVNLETLGQDVVRFAPLVDVISPMAYPATFAEGAYWDPAKIRSSRMYYLVHRTLTGYQELLGPLQAWKLRPWIQGYGVTTQNVRDQLQAVADVGLCGWQFWNASNSYAPVYAAMPSWKEPEGCGGER